MERDREPALLPCGVMPAMSVSEIAQKLGMTEAQVRGCLNRAMKKLRQKTRNYTPTDFEWR